MPNSDVVFCCRKIQTVRFCKHIYSFEVAILNQIVLTYYDDLIDYHSLDVYQITVNGIVRKVIRMRYDLSDAEQ